LSKEIAMTESTPNPPVTPRPAAALLLLRDTGRDRDATTTGGEGGIEVFMVRRHVQSEFVPDVFVFPGGSVQAEDREAELAPGICAPPGGPQTAGPTALGSGFRAAGLRECFEEAGVLLARREAVPLALDPADMPRFEAYRAELQHGATTLGAVAAREGLTLATDEVLHWAHWITPEPFPKRFDTHFFLAQMPARQEAVHDQLETTASAWVAPEDALRRFEAGAFPLVFATVHQLRELVGQPSVRAALERFAGTTPRTIMPRLATRDGSAVILLPDEE
jgi:8-oxo-dGTP pyrophosphatase MutT (NUDIX family)